MMPCIFCKEQSTFEEILFEDEHAYVVYDNFPASSGHCLIIPKQHYENWFVAPKYIQDSIHNLIQKTYDHLVNIYQPAGFNIGANCGAAAGQTVFHLHYHIIPRYNGDHPNPTGGIRLAVGEIGNYLALEFI